MPVTDEMIEKMESEEAEDQDSRLPTSPAPSEEGDQKVQAIPERVEEIEKIKRKKILITLDISDEKVLSLSQDNSVDMFFESNPEGFKVLEMETFSELPKYLRTRYLASQELNKKEKQTLNFAQFKTTGRLARATARRKIHNPKPGMHYAWIAPHDMRDRAYEGMKVCEDPDVQTFGGETTGPKRIGALGTDESVLMEQPLTEADARLALIGEKSRQRIDGSVRRGMGDLSGHKPFIPKGDDDPGRVNFSST